MIASLRYLDTFSKIDGTWYFAERKLILDWSETQPSTPATSSRSAGFVGLEHVAVTEERTAPASSGRRSRGPARRLIDTLFEGSTPILERDALRALHMVPAERY